MKTLRVYLTVGMYLVFAGPAFATNIWLSTSADTTKVGEVPRIELQSDQHAQTLYIWARPDEGKTLQAWDLNLRASTEGVVQFERVDVVNPQFNIGPSVLGNGDVVRFQSVTDSSNVAQSRGSQFGSTELRGIRAFSTNAIGAPGEVVGVGIGGGTKLVDPLYSERNDAWLLATVSYGVVGPGQTDLYLQVGPAGMLNAGERTGDHRVVFGDVSDPPLFGGAPLGVNEDDSRFRGTDSLTPDATVIVSGAGVASSAVPEPASTVLAALAAAVGLVLSHRWPLRCQ